MKGAPVLLGLPRVLSEVAAQRCAVISVLNVTPDSFSDGGLFVDPDVAVRHGVAAVAAGADIVDVGGESTRPGAGRVPLGEELRRVIPVIGQLAARGVSVSIDTSRAAVAKAAVTAGAIMVNDVSGGLADPEMFSFIAEARVPYILMHWRGTSDQMQKRAAYGDVLAEVGAELESRKEAAVSAGVDPQRIIIDPGLGFAKSAEHNWRLLGGLAAIIAQGRPVVIGASRKSFLGELLTEVDHTPRPVGERDDATTAISALAAIAGVWAVRVHHTRAAADAVRVAAAIRRASEGPVTERMGP
jgi:dihydropteroate synthase